MDQLETAEWRNLEVLEEKVVQLDYRSGLDRSRIHSFMKLYEQGYCTLKETGPGDSVHIFTINAAGKAALAARRSNGS